MHAHQNYFYALAFFRVVGIVVQLLFSCPTDFCAQPFPASAATAATALSRSPAARGSRLLSFAAATTAANLCQGLAACGARPFPAAAATTAAASGSVARFARFLSVWCDIFGNMRLYVFSVQLPSVKIERLLLANYTGFRTSNLCDRL